MRVASVVAMRTRSNIPAKSKVVLLSWLLGAGVVTCFAGTAEARKDGAEEGSHGKSNTVLAVDLDFAASLHEPGADTGGGGALRFGREFDFVLISLTPEIGGGYLRFNGDNSAKIYRGYLGGRLGIGKIVEPSVFAHIGVGRLEANLGSHTAPTFDAGVALDLTILPLINLGAHASYNTLWARTDYSAFDWLLFGLHVALVF